MDIMAILIAAAIPSAFTTFCFWMIEQRIAARDKKLEEERQETRQRLTEREEERKRYELYLLKSVNASLALGEATAKAVERIPDAHCNGDMHEALAYAMKVKTEQKDFLTAQAIEALQ